MSRVGVEWLESDAVGSWVPEQGMVYQITVKISEGDILAVVKVGGEGGKKVAFTSARNLEKLAEEVRDLVRGIGGRWRDDQFA